MDKRVRKHDASCKLLAAERLRRRVHNLHRAPLLAAAPKITAKPCRKEWMHNNEHLFAAAAAESCSSLGLNAHMTQHTSLIRHSVSGFSSPLTRKRVPERTLTLSPAMNHHMHHLSFAARIPKHFTNEAVAFVFHTQSIWKRFLQQFDVSVAIYHINAVS